MAFRFRSISWSTIGRITVPTLVLLVGLLLCCLAQPTSAVDVTFPDANLEAAVRAELGIPAPTPISDTDMATMGSLDAAGAGISNIGGLEYAANLTELYLNQNQISDISAVGGMTNLTDLDLYGNQIQTMDLSDSDLSSLSYFNIAGNPLTDALLVNATLSQSSFNVLTDNRDSHSNGIAQASGVLNLDMSGVDFVDILDLSSMYAMDDLQTLLLAGAANLDGLEVVTLTGELDSLNWLDVTALWNSFDIGDQNSLNTWDDIPGNTLVTVPEPAAAATLLALAGMTLIRRRG